MRDSSTLAAVILKLLGKPGDWLPQPFAWQVPRRGAQWLGPVAIVLSTVCTWFAVDSAPDAARLGFFVGLAAIVLMAWSFLLAVRLPLLEPLFGGLDRAYVAHRWCGVLSVVAMYLHTSFEPEDVAGVPGASRSVAEAATDLAETGQTLLYILVGVSLLRWMPYRWWRWTHKLLGLPFLMASWHTWTATKPFANSEPWGWYVTAVMAVGTVAWVWRVLGRDVLARGLEHRVSAVVRSGSTTELTLDPVGRSMRFTAGQFAVVKLALPGLREPHVFTIASDPDARELCFHIRDLGDWTARLQQAELVGATAVVEGPYGMLRPLPPAGVGTVPRVVWVAGGVGITPFLAAISTLVPSAVGARPVLLYCVAERHGATGIEDLRRADADGRIDLVVLASAEGRRFSLERLAAAAGDLRGVHVATCGPRGLTSDVVAAARTLGAGHVETESFDIRSGLGPDLSREIDAARRILSHRVRRNSSVHR